MRKIAMLGTATHSGCQAPFDDEEWQIWGVGSKFKYVTRADRWYEMHRLDGEPQEWATQWRKLIIGFSKNIDLYMMYPEPLGPNVIQYPYQEIIARFGTYFMTSSFSWMMAHAIHELRPLNGDRIDGVIGIWGVDMEYGTEYREQRTGFRHFIDLAGFAGIEVERHTTTGLAYEPVPYPMWQDDPLLNKVKSRMEETRKALDAKDDLRTKTKFLLADNRARYDEVSRNGADKNRLFTLNKEAAGLEDTIYKLDMDIGLGRGSFEEQAWLKDYLVP